MKISICLLILCAFIGISCEEVIHVDLNTGNPRYVIEADLHNLSNEQIIRISQTVAFDKNQGSLAVDDAVVNVISERGQIYPFQSSGNGYYRNMNFMPRPNNEYQLVVRIGNEEFTAKESMPDLVEVDSIGSLEETLFDEISYSVLIKFSDPPHRSNYYRYLVSRNQQPFKFMQAFSDKYNDGLYVTHQLADFNTPFALGDSILIRRQMVQKAVFDYWNQIQMLNPGSAAPGNPKTNISNGAFGYFSVSNTKEYGLTIREYEELKLRE